MSLRGRTELRPYKNLQFVVKIMGNCIPLAKVATVGHTCVMKKPHNILFVICDQLRWDYLSCYGHPHLHTPNIDALAERGVRFNRAYVQSPLCGPSRGSIATGRYVSSFGGGTNFDPIALREKAMGTMLRENGVEPYLIGKFGVRPNKHALETYDIDPDSKLGLNVTHGGFTPIMRDSGIHTMRPDPNGAYNRYLRELDEGYDETNGWHINANSALDADGNLLSGWDMRHAREPANIKEEHSETAYCTDLAVDFLQKADNTKPWMLQLSYIKPHWPIVAPAPYNDMYGPEHVIPVVQSEAERSDAHPVFQAFMDIPYSQTYARKEVRDTVIPTYMGLVKQVDDHFGRILQTLRDTNQWDNTLIIFTSDHGDYLGDHYLGEKDLFHEPSARVPLLVVDPSAAADVTRGTVDERFVELVDLLPTFVDFVGGKIETERLDGASLLPILRGDSAENWRTFAISEIDYSDRGSRELLDQHPYDCHAYMLRTERWKYIYHKRHRPQLFDLKNNPQETIDLGADTAYQSTLNELNGLLMGWLIDLKRRTEIPHAILYDNSPDIDEEDGLFIGRW